MVFAYGDVTGYPCTLFLLFWRDQIFSIPSL